MKIIGQNIVDFSRSKSRAAIFPAIALADGYWHGLCHGSPLPFRRDVDPRGLGTALKFTFVLERIAPGICRFRIAGRHLTELMGLDVAGMPLSALFSVKSRSQIAQVAENICAEPCITEVFIRSGRSIGCGELQGKILMAPLLDDTGQVTRILGCVQTHGTVGRQPRRFEITDVATRALDHPTNGRTLQKNRVRGPEFAEQCAHFEPSDSQKPKNRRPALRLIVNNS